MTTGSFPFDFRIIPVVVINDISDTIPLLSALSRGGINVAEITFRTPCARDAIALAVKECPGIVTGAGTVINASQCREAIDAGAEFIVSPGFSASVLSVCRENGIPYLPGATTATGIMELLEEGIDTIKFFPASACGGAAAIKAFSGAFPQVKFIPTGGISAANMNDYLSLPCVRAVGGSWMLKGTPDEITALSAEAVEALK